jgi:N-carbamoylputrescine amidase
MPKVAAIQFAPTWGGPDAKIASLGRLVELITQAANNGAQLIVAPEMACVGYSFMSPAEAEPMAELLLPQPNDDQMPSTSVQTLHGLANKLGVHIVWGLIEKDGGTGNLFNTQVLACPDWTFESYRKVNLWGNDILWAHEGRGNPPILQCHFPDGPKKVGLLICRDVRDKKDDHWDSFYQKGDADIVCFSANWGDGGFPANAWMDFVKENNATLIVSNRYGEEGPKPNKFDGGGTCIITPKGNKEHPNGVYCDGLVWHQDCIIYADV